MVSTRSSARPISTVSDTTAKPSSYLPTSSYASAARTLVKIGGHTRTLGEDGTQVIDVRFALGKDKNGKTQLQMTAD